jgi:hypothetical protein
MAVVTVERWDHLGRMAEVLKDRGLIDMIDVRVVPDRQEEITPGEAVAGMILNGLGFANRPLSLTPQFFANKPLDLLFRKGVGAEMFNRLSSAAHSMRSMPMAVICCLVSSPWPEFAVYRHFWTQKPCICGVHPLKRPEIHRYMNRSIFLDITAIGSYMRRHVLTNNPTAPQARSRRGLLPACRELLP